MGLYEGTQRRVGGEGKGGGKVGKVPPDSGQNDTAIDDARHVAEHHEHAASDHDRQAKVHDDLATAHGRLADHHREQADYHRGMLPSGGDPGGT